MRPHRAVAPDGTIHVFDPRTGFHEPEAEREEPLRYRGLVIVAGAIVLWAIFIIAAIEAVRAWGAVFG